MIISICDVNFKIFTYFLICYRMTNSRVLSVALQGPETTTVGSRWSIRGLSIQGSSSTACTSRIIKEQLYRKFKIILSLCTHSGPRVNQRPRNKIFWTRLTQTTRRWLRRPLPTPLNTIEQDRAQLIALAHQPTQGLCRKSALSRAWLTLRVRCFSNSSRVGLPHLSYPVAPTWSTSPLWT